MGTSKYQCFHSTTVTYFAGVCLCAPWHAKVQVIPVWGCPGYVRCPLGNCRLRSTQATAASFTATNLLEVGCVGAQGVWYVFALDVCVCVA